MREQLHVLKLETNVSGKEKLKKRVNFFSILKNVRVRKKTRSQ